VVVLLLYHANQKCSQHPHNLIGKSSEVKENVTGDAKRVKKDEDDVESAAV